MCRFSDLLCGTAVPHNIVYVYIKWRLCGTAVPHLDLKIITYYVERPFHINRLCGTAVPHNKMHRDERGEDYMAGYGEG